MLGADIRTKYRETMAVPSSPSKQVSFLKTCINGINALSGIGILSVPYALSSGGWLSLILLLLIAASACFTSLLIHRCMDSNPLITSYPDIAATAFGKKGKITASIFICLELYLVATGLLILEGDNLHKLSPNFALKLGNLTLDGRHSFVIVAGVMIFPSICLSDLGVLSYISFGGVISSLILVAAVFCIGTTKGVGFHGTESLVNFKGLPTALSLYAFCYGAHAMFPTIYSSMRKKSQFPKVLVLSFITCTITYVSMGILGYLICGHNVKSQVTLNLPKEKISSKVAIYTILVGPIAKYALTIMPISTVVESCLPARYRENKPISILIKILLLISTMLWAILFPSFESVTSLIGAVLVVLVSFLFPCVCYLKIFRIYRHFGYELAGISGIILLAVLVGVVGTYSSIAHTIKQA